MIKKLDVEERSLKESIQNNKNISDVKQQIAFEAMVKRETSFFASWKKRNCVITYLPKEQFSLTLKKVQNGGLQQVINLQLTKVSKRCSMVQKIYCFGIQISSGKRYLIGAEDQKIVRSTFETLSLLKKQLKQKSGLGIKDQEKNVKQPGSKQQLEYEKSEYAEQNWQSQRKKQEKSYQNAISTNCSPVYARKLQKQYQRQEVRLQEEENDDDYHTVFNDEPIAMQKQDQLHLKLPLQQQQMEYLQSDQGFKLIESFSQGRILVKNQKIIKINLVIKTHFSQQQLLQSFFHLQLWNQRVRAYKLINRIDEGIYLIYMQLEKKKMLSSHRYCYMMVTTLKIKNQQYLIMKALPKDNFQIKRGLQWIDISIWLKLKGLDMDKIHRFVSICFKVEQQRDFQQILKLVKQIKVYQSFLFTTGKLPKRTLQWRAQQNFIMYQ